MIYTVDNTVLMGKKVRVMVDGVEIKKCLFVDTKKKKVVHYDDPIKLHKHGKRAITRTLRGRCVEVIELEN